MHQVSFDQYKEPEDVPYAKLCKKDFLWLGRISPGMPRDKVMQILKRKSLPITLTKDGCEIKAQGFSPLTSIPSAFRNWQATLSFTNDLLNGIYVDARTD